MTLTFKPLTLKLLRIVARGIGNHFTNFEVPTFGFRFMHELTAVRRVMYPCGLDL